MFQHSCATVFIFDSINLRAHIGLDSLFRLRTLWTLSVAGRPREYAGFCGFPLGSQLFRAHLFYERFPLRARYAASFFLLFTARLVWNEAAGLCAPHRLGKLGRFSDSALANEIQTVKLRRTTPCMRICRPPRIDQVLPAADLHIFSKKG